MRPQGNRGSFLPDGKERARHGSLLSGDQWQDLRDCLELGQGRFRFDIRERFFSKGMGTALRAPGAF